MEHSIGVEAQPCTVSVYHAQALVGTVRGERDDLYLTPTKVVVLGLDGKKDASPAKGSKKDGKAKPGDSEFLFDETHGPKTAPEAGK